MYFENPKTQVKDCQRSTFASLLAMAADYQNHERLLITSENQSHNILGRVIILTELHFRFRQKNEDNFGGCT